MDGERVRRGKIDVRISVWGCYRKNGLDFQLSLRKKRLSPELRRCSRGRLDSVAAQCVPLIGDDRSRTRIHLDGVKEMRMPG